MLRLVPDAKTPFPAYFVKAHKRSKPELRKFCARLAAGWLEVEAALRPSAGGGGAVMLDIDDTLIDGNERVEGGFQHMKAFFDVAKSLYPVHVVTARPACDKARVLALLDKLGMGVPCDRLHLLPTEHYGGPSKHIEAFKFGCFKDIEKRHKRVVARMGDKMWDVSHPDALGEGKYLSHVEDRDTFVFRDPRLRGAISCKLPGV